MKTNKILLGALRVSALVALFAVVPAQAQTVNVELLNNSAVNPISGTYSGVGAASDTGVYWNAIAATPYGTPDFTNSTTLKQSNGSTPTGISFSLTSPEGNFGQGLPETTFADPLMNEWINPGNAGLTGGLTITGLTAGGQYNLYIYSQNGAPSSGFDNGIETFTFGTSKTVTNTGSDTSFVAGANYVEFTLTADGSGDLAGTYLDGTSVSGINGFQIQAVAPVETPEPASLATMSLVGMAMLLFLKRLKKQSV